MSGSSFSIIGEEQGTYSDISDDHDRISTTNGIGNDNYGNDETVSLYHRLLADTLPEGEDDDEILSQLVSLSSRSIRPDRRQSRFNGQYRQHERVDCEDLTRWRHCRNCIHCRRQCRTCSQSRGPYWILLFTILTWFGFMSSVWAAYSCDLVKVEWKNFELAITGIGVWRYQMVNETSPVGEQENVIWGGDGGNDSESNTAQCVSYDGGVGKNQQSVNMDSFFPSDKSLRVYSILAPSFAFAVIFVTVVCLFLDTLYPNMFSYSTIGDDNNTSMRCYESNMCGSISPFCTIAIVAGLFLILAGMFQLFTIFGLLNFQNDVPDTEQLSPICNAHYSECRFGPGGHWAIFAATSFFISGLVAFGAACIGGRRRFRH